MNSKDALSVDRDRFLAYYSSNVGIQAYERRNYELAKRSFEEALDACQRIPDSAENIGIVNKHLQKIDLERQCSTIESRCFL
jgi:predicted metal-dependent hydrolase